MAEPAIVVTDAPDEEAHRAIEGGLDDFNERQAGLRDWRPLAVLARDPATGRVLGGFLGRSSLGLLFIDLVYLPEELRGRNLGSRMLGEMEAEARRRGCRAGVLYTISFQAPGFYERHGWREFGRIACEPPGTSRVFMTKEFTPNRGSRD